MYAHMYNYTRQMLTASRGEPENACTHAQGINELLWVRDSGYGNLFSHVDQRGESWRMEKWQCHRQVRRLHPLQCMV